MTAVATVTTLQQASVGIVGKPTGSTGRFSSVLTDAQVRALLGSGSGGLGAKYLADDSTWKSIDLSGYVPYTGATGAVNLGSQALTCGAITASVASGTCASFSTSTVEVVYVGGTASDRARLLINAVTPGADSMLALLTENASKWCIGVRSSNSNALSFAPSYRLNFPVMVLTTGGSLGIGTTTPVSKLDVAGNLTLKNGTSPTSLFVSNTYTSGTSYGRLGIIANAGQTAYEISSDKGSAGGSNLPINIGHRDSAGTFTSALSVDVSRRCYLYGENYVTNNYSNANIFTTDSQAINKGGKLGLGGVFTGTTPVEFAMISGRKESGTSGDPSGYFQVGVTNSLGAMVEQFRISSTGLATFAGAITASGTIQVSPSTSKAMQFTRSTTNYSFEIGTSNDSLGWYDIHNSRYVFRSTTSNFLINETGALRTLINTGTDDGVNTLQVAGSSAFAGNLILSDTNLITGTTTGTIIATANSQKLGFWGATPIAQPTTAVAAATLVSNLGTPLTDTDTFDGYTLKQIVKALRIAGLLA